MVSFGGMPADQFSAINAHTYLYLENLLDESPCLLLVVSAGSVSADKRTVQIGDAALHDARAVEVLPDSPRITLNFENYIQYSVTNESYSVAAESDRFSGGVFRHYESSGFLEYVNRTTIAREIHADKGPVRHYGIICCDHVIDVATFTVPRLEGI